MWSVWFKTGPVRIKVTEFTSGLGMSTRCQGQNWVEWAGGRGHYQLSLFVTLWTQCRIEGLSLLSHMCSGKTNVPM